ncbi:hypothetical protein CDAR_116531 [Caerostris darwini]|uniref:Uncharacterized protein n=1 Tax=Caerostris darwini TaxID=1538125 RepID=A0AAV4UH69_9ARAC|nr:hypothetical protein CDAR_116531 [Caerostris darwini]
MHAQQNLPVGLPALNPQRLRVAGRNLSPPADKWSSVIIADNYRKQGHWEEGSLFVSVQSMRVSIYHRQHACLSSGGDRHNRVFCCVLLIITFGNDHFNQH